ncbi:MAG: hypothetical protein AAF708_13345 [Deinococcota bacterium]
MSEIGVLEIETTLDENGELHLSTDVLGELKPNTAITLTLKTADKFNKKETPLYEQDADTWLNAFNNWVDSHRDTPTLTLEHMSRDTIYD